VVRSLEDPPARVWIVPASPTMLRGPMTTSPPRLPFHYGRATRAILRSAIAVLRPRGGEFDLDLDERTLRSVLTFVPYMQPFSRWGFPLGLWLLELSPVLLGYGFTRMSSLEPSKRAGYLSRWEHAFGPFRTLYDGLRALVLMCFYQQPEILALLQIDWQARADELTERRARLQRMAPELANPRNVGREAR
jgi:hypothetical protein